MPSFALTVNGGSQTVSRREFLEAGGALMIGFSLSGDGAAQRLPGADAALGKIANCFAVESFTDELAAAARRDPVKFRLQGLADPRGIEVLQRAAALIGCQPRPSPSKSGPGRGVAYIHYKNNKSYVAMAVEAEGEKSSGAIRVRRLRARLRSHHQSRPREPVAGAAARRRRSGGNAGAGRAGQRHLRCSRHSPAHGPVHAAARAGGACIRARRSMVARALAGDDQGRLYAGRLKPPR